MAEGRDPFVRVQYNYSREIEQLDITVILGMMIKKKNDNLNGFQIISINSFY